jgi:signal transduction histidine kinase
VADRARVGGASPTRSLRIRLTLLASAVIAVVLAAATVLLVLLFQRSLTNNSDELSQSRAADLLYLAERNELPESITTVGEDGIAQVVDAQGTVLVSSSDVEDHPPITSVWPEDDDDAVGVVVKDAPDEEETEDYRVWVLRGDTPSGPVVAIVGMSPENISESVASLIRNLAIALPLILVALICLVWVFVGRTLRPVEAAAVRQRAFVADASHELQSPLASFRAQLEVALEHPAGTDWESTARDLLADSDRMERLVRDLLFLARQEEATAPARLVDLDDVVLEESARLRTRSSKVIDTSGVSAAPVRGSVDDLTRLVRNLLDNAERHADSKVVVATWTTADGVRLTVTDDGPGVPPEHQQRLFERFYRVDESRGPDSGSTGLGLAIVKAVAERHGGSVELTPWRPGAQFGVHLPSA